MKGGKGGSLNAQKRGQKTKRLEELKKHGGKKGSIPRLTKKKAINP